MSMTSVRLVSVVSEDGVGEGDGDGVVVTGDDAAGELLSPPQPLKPHTSAAATAKDRRDSRCM